MEGTFSKEIFQWVTLGCYNLQICAQLNGLLQKSPSRATVAAAYTQKHTVTDGPDGSWIAVLSKRQNQFVVITYV